MAVPLAEPSAHGTGHIHNPAAGARMQGHEQLRGVRLLVAVTSTKAVFMYSMWHLQHPCHQMHANNIQHYSMCLPCFTVTFSTLFFFLSLWFGDSTFDDSEADCPGFLRSESSCSLWCASKIQLCCWRNISAKHVQQIQQYIITYHNISKIWG